MSDATIDRNALARIIWETSRADEGTISATGANILADAVIAHLSGGSVKTPTPFTFTFDWVKSPLSLNYRLYRMQEAKITKEIRSLMHASARRIPPMEKCRVELVWWVNTKHRRDEENIVPVLKALCDGLVDAEVVRDDTREYMTKMMPAVLYVPKRERVSCFQFTVTEIAA